MDAPAPRRLPPPWAGSAAPHSQWPLSGLGGGGCRFSWVMGLSTLRSLAMNFRIMIWMKGSAILSNPLHLQSPFRGGRSRWRNLQSSNAGRRDDMDSGVPDPVATGFVA